MRLGARFGLAVVNPVSADGSFDERAGRYAGKHVEDAAAGLLADLRARGRVLRTEERERDAPHCSYCATRLLPYAKASGTSRPGGRRPPPASVPTTASGCCRASAGGGRRCRSGSAPTGT